MKDADAWIKTLRLLPHPEGGYYRESYRSEDALSRNCLPVRFGGPRVFSTAIYFLLKSGQRSHFHRLRADEIWHHYAGGPLKIYILGVRGSLKEVILGGRGKKGELPQRVVPAGLWFGAEPAEPDSFCLAGCTVAPGFDFSDFELAGRAELLREFPRHRRIIKKFFP